LSALSFITLNCSALWNASFYNPLSSHVLRSESRKSDVILRHKKSLVIFDNRHLTCPWTSGYSPGCTLEAFLFYFIINPCLLFHLVPLPLLVLTLGRAESKNAKPTSSSLRFHGCPASLERADFQKVEL